jgi:hypothetical protein
MAFGRLSPLGILLARLILVSHIDSSTTALRVQISKCRRGIVKAHWLPCCKASLVPIHAPIGNVKILPLIIRGNPNCPQMWAEDTERSECNQRMQDVNNGNEVYLGALRERCRRTHSSNDYLGEGAGFVVSCSPRLPTELRTVFKF